MPAGTITRDPTEGLCAGQVWPNPLRWRGRDEGKIIATRSAGPSQSRERIPLEPGPAAPRM